MIAQAPLTLTVSQLNTYLKMKLEEDPRLSSVLVTGEISNFTNHYKSGHLYFSLKDERSLVRAVMFARSAARLRFLPKDGMKVLARGRISLYEASGQYQLYVEDLQPDGLGALNLAYEQLKEKLGEGVVVLASAVDGKVSLMATATDRAQKKGAHAGNLIKAIAGLVGGGGGGRPGMAQAGGKNPDGIDAAIAKVAEAAAEQIK